MGLLVRHWTEPRKHLPYLHPPWASGIGILLWTAARYPSLNAFGKRNVFQNFRKPGMLQWEMFTSYLCCSPPRLEVLAWNKREVKLKHPRFWLSKWPAVHLCHGPHLFSSSLSLLLLGQQKKENAIFHFSSHLGYETRGAVFLSTATIWKMKGHPSPFPLTVEMKRCWPADLNRKTIPYL